MAQENAERVSSQYYIHDLGFYKSSYENGSKIIDKYTVGFPTVADSYRVANVIIAKSSPIVIFRLMSIDEVCFCNEMYLQILLLNDSSVYCSLIGNDKFNKVTKYFGDIVLTNEDLEFCSPLSFTINKLTGVSVGLRDSKELLKKYLYEGIFYNKVCSRIKDSIMFNTDFN